MPPIVRLNECLPVQHLRYTRSSLMSLLLIAPVACGQRVFETIRNDPESKKKYNFFVSSLEWSFWVTDLLQSYWKPEIWYCSFLLKKTQPLSLKTGLKSTWIFWTQKVRFHKKSNNQMQFEHKKIYELQSILKSFLT